MPFFDVLFVILPVFLVIAAGALYARIGNVPPTFAQGLLGYSQTIGIPCLLFRAMIHLDLDKTFDINLLAAFYIPALLCFLVGIVIARKWLNQGNAESVTLGFSAMYSNALLLGVPITEMAFGPGASADNFIIVAFQPPICYTIGVVAMEIVRSGGKGVLHTVRAALTGTIRQPHVLAIAAGLCINMAGVGLPSVVRIPVDMLAAAALPVALVGLGGVLVHYPVHGSLTKLGVVLGIALVLSPAVTLLFGLMLSLSPAALKSAVITAAMAPGVNSVMFASMYRTAQELASSAIVMGTILSVLTTTGCIVLLKAMF